MSALLPSGQKSSSSSTNGSVTSIGLLINPSANSPSAATYQSREGRDASPRRPLPSEPGRLGEASLPAAYRA